MFNQNAKNTISKICIHIATSILPVLQKGWYMTNLKCTTHEFTHWQLALFMKISCCWVFILDYILSHLTFYRFAPLLLRCLLNYVYNHTYDIYTCRCMYISGHMIFESLCKCPIDAVHVIYSTITLFTIFHHEKSNFLKCFVIYGLIGYVYLYVLVFKLSAYIHLLNYILWYIV